MNQTTYPAHPLPSKPPRYRADTSGLSRFEVGRVAAHCESVEVGRDHWRRAAAFWHHVDHLQRDACLAIATSNEQADAWREYRLSHPHLLLDRLTYRAFGFRWLLANDCLHEHLVFAADSDPIRDTALMQLLVEGMDLTAREDELLDSVVQAAGSLRGVEQADRPALVERAVEALYVSGSKAAHFGGLGKAAVVALVEPWVDVAVGLGHTPGEVQSSRPLVTLTVCIGSGSLTDLGGVTVSEVPS